MIKTLIELAPFISSLASLVAAFAAVLGVVGWRRKLRWERIYNELTGAKRAIAKTQWDLSQWHTSVWFLYMSEPDKRQELMTSVKYREQITNQVLNRYDSLYEAIVLLDSVLSDKYPERSKSVLEAKQDFQHYAHLVNEALNSEPVTKINGLAHNTYETSEFLRELSRFVVQLNKKL
ncbi:hypothetical protein V6H34_005002 [Vibrio harveyi]